MAHTPRFEILPPERNKKYSGGGFTGSRLGHEHDMNDAFGARVNWYEQFKDLERRIQRDAVNKAIDEHKKRSFMIWPILVYFQMFAIVEIVLLKFFGII